ncbi:hypothetical protein NDU88_006187 [Pleurodeles waltl]|uniref:Uncharacterized protein n=1 Tax=Pleurodeles waltl TaxID=8319 RepID=A0AAV7RN90_PLEWA|nr:hypothetical protein NDU88_006187 [Pleurodeles waltl]
MVSFGARDWSDGVHLPVAAVDSRTRRREGWRHRTCWSSRWWAERVTPRAEEAAERPDLPRQERGAGGLPACGCAWDRSEGQNSGRTREVPGGPGQYHIRRELQNICKYPIPSDTSRVERWGEAD